MDNAKSARLPDSTEYLAECLRIARESSGKTISDISQLLGISGNRLRQYENGKLIPALPEVESLSYIYRIPLPALFDPRLLSKSIHAPDGDQLRQLLLIRQEIIATRLQLAREKAGKTQGEVAKAASIPLSRLKKYESGEMSIPLPDLIRLAEIVELPLDDLVDKDSPIGLWQTLQENAGRFNQIPEEDRSFVLSDENLSFLALARQLKMVGLDDLAKLSESIRQVIESTRVEK